MAAMDVDEESPPSARRKESATGFSGGNKPRFEVKKWNAVALWAWGENY